MDRLAKRLLNDFQKDFPLVSRPFEAVGQKVGASEEAVLAMLEVLQGDGTVSRVGPVFRPNRIGVSTLAALSAPPERLEEVAEQVSRHPEVNHNYEREHALNLWFVATASSAERLSETLAEIERETGCKVLALPLQEEFHIDLGFGLWR